MMTRFFVSFVVASGTVFALACSGSSQPVFGDDGGTGGGGSGSPFGSLGGGNGGSSSGGSTSGGIGSSGSTSGGTSSSGGISSSGGTSSSGGSTSGGSSSGGSLAACAMNSTGNATCDQCLVTNCCNQFHACAAEPQCKSVLNCAGQCAQGDQACVDTCKQQYPNGVQPAQAAANCWSQNCNAACPL